MGHSTWASNSIPTNLSTPQHSSLYPPLLTVLSSQEWGPVLHPTTPMARTLTWQASFPHKVDNFLPKAQGMFHHRSTAMDSRICRYKLHVNVIIIQINHFTPYVHLLFIIIVLQTIAPLVFKFQCLKYFAINVTLSKKASVPPCFKRWHLNQ